MNNLNGKTLLVTGSSRGIGKAIALRAARDGARIAVVAKSGKPHPKLPGTVYTAAEEIESVGGKALPMVADVRFEDQVQSVVDQTVNAFGGIDILVNNASAISLTGTLQTEMKRYDLMHQINTRGTFLCSRLCIPHLRKAINPHVLNLSPPLNIQQQWFAPHLAYTMSKYGMSLCVLGMSGEFRNDGIAFNALWPKTIIDTAAVRNLLGGEPMARRARSAEIVADAANLILTRDSKTCSGNFFIDEDVLRDAGVVNFDQYLESPGIEPVTDLFI